MGQVYFAIYEMGLFYFFRDLPSSQVGEFYLSSDYCGVMPHGEFGYHRDDDLKE